MKGLSLAHRPVHELQAQRRPLGRAGVRDHPHGFRGLTRDRAFDFPKARAFGDEAFARVVEPHFAPDIVEKPSAREREHLERIHVNELRARHLGHEDAVAVSAVKKFAARARRGFKLGREFGRKAPSQRFRSRVAAGREHHRFCPDQNGIARPRPRVEAFDASAVARKQKPFGAREKTHRRIGFSKRRHHHLHVVVA